jgi:hypothetical protein
MSRTWQLLQPDQSEPPSLSISNREDVMKISDWSAVRVKAEKFKEVDFDNLVTEENLRQFLGYNIPRDKRTITKRGAVKKRSDAPPSPRHVTKKRPSSRAEEIPEDVPLRKKWNIPLAASGVKRTSLRVFMAGTNNEEGSASFRGFVPEVSPTQRAGSLPIFALSDESRSEASYQGSDTPLAEANVEASTTTSPVTERSEGVGELILGTQTVQVTRRVKHLGRKRKFGARDRLAGIISEAERMWGRPVIRPSDAEEVRQESVPSGEESVEERDEDVSTPRDEAFIEDFVEEGTPQTPSIERLGTPPPPSCDWEMGHATLQEPCTAPDQTEPQMETPERVNTEGPGSSQQASIQNTPGASLEVGGANQLEASQHLEAPEEPRVNAEATTLEVDPHPEASDRDRLNIEASTSELRPNKSG